MDRSAPPQGFGIRGHALLSLGDGGEPVALDVGERLGEMSGSVLERRHLGELAVVGRTIPRDVVDERALVGEQVVQRDLVVPLVVEAELQPPTKDAGVRAKGSVG